MSYTDEIVRAKLSALNETQESIVTAAQWIMFHRRHADDTAQLWLEKIRSSNAPKKLNLVYLANEVVQQSKAREKEDFLIAFSPIIAEATAVAYKGSPTDIQQKIRRVVEIWRQRRIFDEAIQGAIETRIDEIDRTKSTGKKPLLGGSLFTTSTTTTSIPADLQPLVPLQLSSSKSSAAASTAASAASAEYDKLYGSTAQIPTPPVYAARLSQLLKSLAHAENSVFESIKSRTQLIAALEKLLDTNREALGKEQAQHATLTQRKERTENKKREVEDAIMRGLATEPTVADALPDRAGAGAAAGDGADAPDPALRSPVVEALTPPPVEALTPLGSPDKQPQQQQPQQQESSSRPPSFSLPNAPRGSGAPAAAPTEAVPGLSNLLQVLGGGNRAASSGTVNAGVDGAESSSANTGKRRKISHNDDAGDEIASAFDAGYGNGNEGDAMAGLDEDVAELLRQESQKYPPAGQS